MVIILLKTMNPEPGFQSGPGDSVDADKMASCLIVTKSSPPLGGGSENQLYVIIENMYI